MKATSKKQFPDCSLYHMPQRSGEWYAVRKGLLTASEFGPFLTEEPKVRLTKAEIMDQLHLAGIEFKKSAKVAELADLLPDKEIWMARTAQCEEAREKAVCKMLAQAAGCWEPQVFETEAMRRGIELEEEAIAHFEKATGEEVAPVGFCKSNYGQFGCSPDGLIMQSGEGVESKVPIPAAHCQYLLSGKLPWVYVHQIHGSMAVTGAKAWWFQSYCPGLPPLILKINRSDYTEKVLAGLVELTEEMEAARLRLSEQWQKWSKA